MAWTKTKVMIAAGVLLAGTTAIAFKTVAAHKVNSGSWRSLDIDSAMLERTPPQVAILPTKFPAGTSRRLLGSANGPDRKTVELGVAISDIVTAAYGGTSARTVFATDLPQDRYDFICTLSQDALQQELKKQFSLIGHRETRETDVLLLEVKNQNAPGLKLSKNSSRGRRSFQAGQGHISGVNISSENIAGFLERQLKIPVIDQTGLADKGFDFDLTWDQPEGLKQAVLDQLGLELVPDRKSVEMLVVEKEQ